MIRLVALVSLLASGSVLAQPEEYLRTRVPDASLCLHWRERVYRYSYHSAGSEQTPGTAEFVAMDDAFATWRALAAECSDFVFEKGPAVGVAEIGYDPNSDANVNVLVFREQACREVVPAGDPCVSDDSCSAKYQCWDHSEGTIALTTTTFSFKTGIIYDADIEFNAAPNGSGQRFLFTTISTPPCEDGAESPLCAATDVQNTLTHELGHVIGLDHVEALDSTMAPTAPLGETSKRVLDPGTRRGFCSTYPKGRPTPSCDEVLLEGELHITAENRGTPGLSHMGCAAGGVGAPLLGLVALWFIRRRDPC